MKGLLVFGVLMSLYDQANGLECFTCHHSLRSKDLGEGLSQHPECLSINLIETLGNGMKRNCTELEPYCTSIVSTVNGFFVEIERNCVEICKPYCVSNGFGLDNIQCTRCCQTDYCNNRDGREFLQNSLAYNKRQINIIRLILIVMFVNKSIA